MQLEKKIKQSKIFHFSTVCFDFIYSVRSFLVVAKKKKSILMYENVHLFDIELQLILKSTNKITHRE